MSEFRPTSFPPRGAPRAALELPHSVRSLIFKRRLKLECWVGAQNKICQEDGGHWSWGRRDCVSQAIKWAVLLDPEAAGVAPHPSAWRRDSAAESLFAAKKAVKEAGGLRAAAEGVLESMHGWRKNPPSYSPHYPGDIVLLDVRGLEQSAVARHGWDCALGILAQPWEGEGSGHYLQCYALDDSGRLVLMVFLPESLLGIWHFPPTESA